MSKDPVSDSQQNGVRKSRRMGFVLGIGVILLAVAYLAIGVSMGSGVRSISATALREFPGDKVSALMTLVESEQHGLRERNRAVWALGQLGDPRALPLLERLYTGTTSDESNGPSQYELKKAIALCKGATNISALVWRHGALAKR